MIHKIRSKSSIIIAECNEAFSFVSICQYRIILILDEKPGFETQDRHQNKVRKVFLRRHPHSRFLAKTLRVMKSFSRNLSFGVDIKLQVPPLMYKINKHDIRGVRNQVNNPDKGCNDHLYIYVWIMFNYRKFAVIRYLYLYICVLKMSLCDGKMYTYSGVVLGYVVYTR